MMGSHIYIKSKSVLFLWNDLFLWELFSIVCVCVCVSDKFQKRYYSNVFIESLLSRHTWSFYCVPGSGDTAKRQLFASVSSSVQGESNTASPTGLL